MSKRRRKRIDYHLVMTMPMLTKRRRYNLATKKNQTIGLFNGLQTECDVILFERSIRSY
jgi:hypothetical protein